MTFWAAGAIVVGSAINANSAKKASDAVGDSTRESNAFQKEIFDKQTELNAPFRENGLAGQNRLMDLLGLSKNTTADGFGSLNKQFGMDSFEQDPGYKWRIQQGQHGLDRSAAARGGMFSGRAMKDAMNYNQGAASQEYGNAFNRFQTNRSNILNPLQSLSGMAQSATNQINQNAQNYGNNVSNGLMAGGEARGSGYMGQGAAINNGLNSWMNYSQNQNMMNKMFPTQAKVYPNLGGDYRGNGTGGD